MANVQSTGGRNSPALVRRDAFLQRELVVITEGFRALRSYIAIAHAVQTLGRDKRVELIESLIVRYYRSYECGMEGFLRSQGVPEEEIATIVAHYGDRESHFVIRRENDVATVVASPRPPLPAKKSPRPSVEETTTAYGALNEFIRDRVVEGNLPLLIAQKAQNELGVMCTEKSVLATFGRYGGLSGFLEHHGYSKVEAKKLADKYEEMRRTLNTMVR